ncbi:uncharacterized protein K02A2.6-like [Corticium candelabrum]|uniref:uncharacterized protein K02A2.6-like n=1 Tax=Corticium candelabrum TaxID=121492 RepID=UPI002E25BBE0|nr:uncharacterized protein K02A2.6-like [Corticium candelabrum]
MAREGHSGMVKTKQKCRTSVWWPGIDKQIQDHVRSCAACIQGGKSIKPTKSPLNPVKWPKQPWQKLKIVIVGEIHGAPSTHKYIIVVHDLHCKWPEIHPCSHVNSQRVFSFLCDLFTRWGLSEVIILDNDPPFRSHEFTSFLANKGIKHSTTAFYHPQSNRGVERFNQTPKQGLGTHRAQGLTFDQALQETLLNYRSLRHFTTGYAPSQLMIRRQFRLPLSILQPPFQVVTSDVPTTDQLAQDIKSQQAKIKAYFDHKHPVQIPKFQPGQE